MAEDTNEATVVSEAYAAARELLRQAEVDATRLRADADRYVRRREQEVELLIAKARRLLEVAEGRAAAMAAARAAPPAAAADHAPAPTERVAIDLNAGTAGGRLQSELDRLLAHAIGKALDRSFLHGP